jgi:hypothetical protein
LLICFKLEAPDTIDNFTFGSGITRLVERETANPRTAARGLLVIPLLWAVPLGALVRKMLDEWRN